VVVAKVELLNNAKLFVTLAKFQWSEPYKVWVKLAYLSRETVHTRWWNRFVYTAPSDWRRPLHFSPPASQTTFSHLECFSPSAHEIAGAVFRPNQSLLPIKTIILLTCGHGCDGQGNDEASCLYARWLCLEFIFFCH